MRQGLVLAGANLLAGLLAGCGDTVSSISTTAAPETTAAAPESTDPPDAASTTSTSPPPPGFTTLPATSTISWGGPGTFTDLEGGATWKVVLFAPEEIPHAGDWAMENMMDDPAANKVVALVAQVTNTGPTPRRDRRDVGK